MRDRYQLVTFDMGLTLVHMEPFAQILGDVCREHRISAELERLQAAVDVVWRDVLAADATAAFETTPSASRAWWRNVNLRTLEAAGLPVERWDALEARFMVLLDDPASYAVFPDVIGTLGALRQAGYRLGVISNWGWNLPDLCREWGLDTYFDFVLPSSRVGCAKPNPRIFRQALHLAGVEAGAALHVGDSLYADVGGARSAGMDALFLNRTAEPAPGDTPTIRNLTELLALLDLGG